jgi:acyl-CoA thioesterase
MEHIKTFFKKDKFAKYIGADLIEVTKGCAKGKMKIESHHLNGMGSVQGGTIFTLADFVFAAACNSHEIVAVAIDCNITFMKAVSSGTLYATAEENSINPKLGSYNIKVTTEEGELVAVFQGLAYRKKDKLAFD